MKPIILELLGWMTQLNPRKHSNASDDGGSIAHKACGVLHDSGPEILWFVRVSWTQSWSTSLALPVETGSSVSFLGLSLDVPLAISFWKSLLGEAFVRAEQWA